MGNKKHDKHSKHEKHTHNGHDDAFAQAQATTSVASDLYPGTIVPQQPWEGALAITGARLIDGTGADPIDNATIIVEGERITALGPSDDVAIPGDATVIEADGKTALPGLIDCHVH